MTTITTAAGAPEIQAQIDALQTQLDDANDAIGASALDWRQAAANPGAAARAAQVLGEKERTRDVLAAALAQAQQVLAQLHADARAARFQVQAQEARELVNAALERRVLLGQELAAAVAHLGDLVQGLNDQAAEVSALFSGGAPVFLASGVGESVAKLSLNTEDVRHLVDQTLGVRLRRLWPTETAPASQNIDLAALIAAECVPTRIAFEDGLAARAAAE